MSKAAAGWAPMRAWMPEAMLGTWSSWLQVPKTMSSTLPPSMPAAASARAGGDVAEFLEPHVGDAPLADARCG